nr:sulfotransferase [Streptomyces sp. SID5643]
MIAEHPEIEREPIEKPVFVVGLPRTATTVTHAVLSISEEHRSPLLGELLAPDLELPPRQRRRAIAAGRRMVRGTDLFAPRFRDIHAMAAEGPEECTFALPHALMPFSQARAPPRVPGLALRAGLHRRLPVPQAGLPGAPVRPSAAALDAQVPMHVENLDALLTVFPDATIVWCHRDPVTVVASFCSLIEHGMAVSTRPVDLAGIGATWLELLSRAMTRGLAARTAIPPEQLVDAPYSWLGSGPASGAPGLYAAVGARWTGTEAGRLAAAVARPKGTRKHTYDLSRYGLTRDEVESAFADDNVLRAGVDRA